MITRTELWHSTVSYVFVLSSSKCPLHLLLMLCSMFVMNFLKLYFVNHLTFHPWLNVAINSLLPVFPTKILFCKLFQLHVLVLHKQWCFLCQTGSLRLSAPIYTLCKLFAKQHISLGTALFWVVTQWVVVISYQHFGTTYRSHPRGSRSERNYHYSLHNNPEEHSSQVDVLFGKWSLREVYIGAES